MKLYFLVEATLSDIKKRIPIFIKKYYRDIAPDEAVGVIEPLAALDPSKGKYTEWIIRQYKSGKIRMPEDGEKITGLLKKFHQNKGRLENKDLASYSPGDLSKALEGVGASRRQNKKLGRAGEIALPRGAELVRESGPFKIVKITDPKASSILCSGTEWCVANVETAIEYLEKGPLYLVYKNGKRYAMASAPEDQVMDVYDEPIYDDEELYKILIDIDSGFIRATGAMRIDNAIRTGNRVRDYEHLIVKDAWRAGEYAEHAIKGRWPEAEPYIMKNEVAAANYAKHVIKGRWPEAEPYIMKNPIWAVHYAEDVIKGPWPEAEPYIKKSDMAYDRYRDFLNGTEVDIFGSPLPLNADGQLDIFGN